MSRGSETILGPVRSALNRARGAPLPPRPPILPARTPEGVDAEIDRLLREIGALSGSATRLSAAELDQTLEHLVREQEVRRATLWPTPRLAALGIAERLSRLGVEIVAPHAGKHALAECDLGVTEADFALPETGTLGLLSSLDKPRAVSLLPRVHLAIVGADALRADLHQVFAEAKGRGYLILITGPSRTADIELTVTLGVHGPRALYAWLI